MAKRCAIVAALVLQLWLVGLVTLAAPPVINRQMEIIEAAIDGSSPYTVDPASCYDTASGELLANCYDTLITHNGERSDQYLPQLATQWAVVENNPPIHDPDTGLDLYYTYFFRIREGVPFHDSAFGNLTPRDVEYCFERGMVLDVDGGPQWLFYEPLLNGASAEYVNQKIVNPQDNMTERTWVGKCIDHAIESNTTHAWFNLAYPGIYPPLMQALTGPWSSIFSKSWALSLGRPSMWNGDWGDYTGWHAYHNPYPPPLDDPSPAVMGTGPFKLSHLDNGAMYWDADRFLQYWAGWPLDWPAMGLSRPAGYVDHFEVTWAYDWPTRLAMFQNGDLDVCAVPRTAYSSVIGSPGIRCFYPLPSLALSAVAFRFDLNFTNPWNNILPAATFGENGIPKDFFGNSEWAVHVRRAFAFSTDYSGYLETGYLGEALKPATAIILGVRYHDPTIKGYTYNLTRAAEELQQVPGLWETGFTLNLPYWLGSSALNGLWQDMIANALNSLNPKFHVSAVGMPWILYMDAIEYGQAPAYTSGWLGDYPDPHNFAYAFYHSRGYLPLSQAYRDPVLDDLITQGVEIPNSSERAELYSEIQNRAIDTCPNFPLIQPFYRHFERDWICSWYYNPTYWGIRPANTWKWYYVPHSINGTASQPTSNYLPFDVNYDGKINMADIGMVASGFGSRYDPPIEERWFFRSDANNDRGIDMKDIALVARNFGQTSAIWAPP